jgi:hypothetical protein
MSFADDACKKNRHELAGNKDYTFDCRVEFKQSSTAHNGFLKIPE